jgi:hypothetical protein
MYSRAFPAHIVDQAVNISAAWAYFCWEKVTNAAFFFEHTISLGVTQSIQIGDDVFVVKMVIAEIRIACRYAT